MTRAEIIYMARETDCLDGQHYGTVWVDKLERFAALVAADEREACARVCESTITPNIDWWNDACQHCATAIRARGEK